MLLYCKKMIVVCSCFQERDKVSEDLIQTRMRVAALEAEREADERWREEFTQRRLQSAENATMHAEAEELERLKTELNQLHLQRREQQLRQVS